MNKQKKCFILRIYLLTPSVTTKRPLQRGGVGRPELQRRRRQQAKADSAVEVSYNVTPVLRWHLVETRALVLEVFAVGRRENLPRSAAPARRAAPRPSTSVPALKSIQLALNCDSGVLVAIFIVGTNDPNGVPRPVVNNTS